MEVNSLNLVEVGNLAIGLGTFFLAGAVLYVNNRNTKKNQRIHLADKRSKWVEEFRIQLSSFMTELNQIYRSQLTGVKFPSNEAVRPLYNSMNMITLLVNEDDVNSKILLEDLGEILEMVLKEKKDYGYLTPKIFETAKKITDKEWGLIKNLED